MLRQTSEKKRKLKLSMKMDLHLYCVLFLSFFLSFCGGGGRQSIWDRERMGKSYQWDSGGCSAVRCSTTHAPDSRKDICNASKEHCTVLYMCRCCRCCRCTQLCAYYYNQLFQIAPSSATCNLFVHGGTKHLFVYLHRHQQQQQQQHSQLLPDVETYSYSCIR